MVTLYNSDCLDTMECIEDKSVDLIFCDLPYGQSSCQWDCLIDLDKLWIEFMRIKKLNTPIIMTCTTKFGLSLLNSCPKNCPFRYDLVWCKSSSAGFLRSGTMPLRKHEMIYVFYEKLPFYDLSSHTNNFIEEEGVKIDIAVDGAYGKGINIINAKHRKNKYKYPLPTSLLEIKSTRGKHSTEKPVALMEWILKYYSKENDIVFDPTMGSGSMGVACINMNRNFIGIEKDNDIYQVAVNRIEN
tara:strand:+ start:65 stop:793 length:729 start_codon:yes stop_codon:yes gene_type:complete